MRERLPKKVWDHYFALRRNGFAISEAATTAGVGYSTAKAKERGMRQSDGSNWLKAARESEVGPPEPIPFEKLIPEALRALDDFPYFRRRYLGRISTPWQEEVAYRIVDLLATKRKEYVVINVAPGSGKSSLLTCDIPLWLTVKRRGIRGLIGSASSRLAENFLINIRNLLETPYPVLAEDDQKVLGIAVDAEATLVQDFGMFKSQTGVWSNKSLVVEQYGGHARLKKDPTWSAFGLDADFIGGRFDICLFDDVVDESDFITLERVEKLQNRWNKMAEKRLDPGGLSAVIMQRLAPNDLSRYCLDKTSGAGEVKEHTTCCSAEPDRKYHHFVYRAHYDDRCEQTHGEDAPYWPEGCLLDPRRLPWSDLASEMENDPDAFLQVYQQEDSSPGTTLVQDIWITGGTDPVTKELFVGCWDKERDLCELPNGAGPMLSVASTDPSPTKMWATQWWCIGRDEFELRYLMDLDRRAMKLGEFLDYHGGRYSGLMEEWFQRSKDLNHRITHWVIEANAAQRFMLEIDQFRRWASSRQVNVIAHQTHRNKADPKYGPQILAPLYRHGKIRLPGMQRTRARFISMKLVDEVKRWPKGAYDDELMAQWFVEYNLARKVLNLTEIPVPTRSDVPAWMREEKAMVGAA